MFYIVFMWDCISFGVIYISDVGHNFQMEEYSILNKVLRFGIQVDKLIWIRAIKIP